MSRTSSPMSIPLFRRLLQAIERAPMDRADKERLTHFAVFVLFGQIMFVAYCVYSFVVGDLLQAALIFMAINSLVLGWLLLCHLPLGQLVYRVCAVIYGGFLLYLLAVGGEGGSKSLWMLTFPFFIIFLTGIKEGIVWSTLLLTAALVVLFVPLSGVHPFPYSHAFMVRFASVYVVVAAIASWSEHFRLYYRTTQELKLRQLRAVIDGLPEPVRLEDRAGRLLLCNPAYLAMIGLSRDEVFDEELIDNPDTPPDMDLSTISLPSSAGEACQLLLWRKRQANGLHGQYHDATSPGPTAPPHHDISTVLLTPDPIAPAGDLIPSSATSIHHLPTTILLAEDDAMLRQLGTQMLAGLGYQVLTAADGEEAVVMYLAHQQDISLVLCDQWMPRMNGWQLLAALRAINPSVPVIMISGAAANSTEGSESAEQPNASLKKPYGMDQLQQTIQEVLAHGQTPTT